MPGSGLYWEYIKKRSPDWAFLHPSHGRWMCKQTSDRQCRFYSSGSTCKMGVKNRWAVRLGQMQLACANSDGHTAGHIIGLLQMLEPVDSLGVLGNRDNLGIFCAQTLCAFLLRDLFIRMPLWVNCWEFSLFLFLQRKSEGYLYIFWVSAACYVLENSNDLDFNFLA